MTVRKHLYLITEHEEDDRVGGVSITDSRKTGGQKNVETNIYRFDEEHGDFYEAGKEVHLGYIEFESEEAYGEEPGDVLAKTFQKKIRDVDRQWAEKAGVAEVAYEEVDA